MKRLKSMQKNLDTVEEFWSKKTVADAYKNANDQSLEKFIKKFSGFLGVSDRSVKITPSGKSALERLLSAKKDKRSTVMVPALNCVRVKDAIEHAGCTVLTYDFNSEPGRFDWDTVLQDISDDVGVLIITHLYGVPTDLRAARKICTDKEILLIEDCAQILGGSIAGRQVGTWGDASIFSFSYDKPISLGWGGVAVVNAPEKFILQEHTFKFTSLLKPACEIDFFQNFIKSMEVRRLKISLSKLSLLSLFYRLCNKNKLSAFYKRDIEFGALQAELGIFCFDKYSEIRVARNANSDAFASLSPFPTWPITDDEIEPAWLKQKISVHSPSQVSLISRDLQKNGVRAGNFNWPKLLESSGSPHCPVASQVASCWMEVPIHQRMNIQNIEFIISILKKYA